MSGFEIESLQRKSKILLIKATHLLIENQRFDPKSQTIPELDLQ